MKITGGKYRNRNIEVMDDKALRPTMSRTREMIFNILRHGRFHGHESFIPDDNPSRIEGRMVADLFCGTGALGLEALSYGAVSVTFIDQSQQRLNLARENAKLLGEIDNVSFVRSDSSSLPRAMRQHDLVFIDPPYTLGLGAPALKSLVKQGWLKFGAVVLIEGGKEDDAPEVEGYTLLDTRVLGRTRISVLQFKG